MGTYNIPRNTKGEGRLFYIFSTKALIYTVAGILVGAIFKGIFSVLGSIFKGANGIFSVIGIIMIVIFAILGFIIGTFKLPQNDKFEITRKAGGIQLDKVIFEAIKFHFKRDKYYVYDTQELAREEILKEYKQKEETEERERKLREEKNAQSSLNRRGYIK